MLVLEKPEPKPLFCFKIKLLQSSRNELSSRWLGEEKNSEIVAIPNIYKDTLDDFIDNSDPESPPGLIDKGSYNAPRSRSDSTGFLEEDYLDEDNSASDRSSRLAPKSKNFQLHQHRDVGLFISKSGRA